MKCSSAETWANKTHSFNSTDPFTVKPHNTNTTTNNINNYVSFMNPKDFEQKPHPKIKKMVQKTTIKIF